MFPVKGLSVSADKLKVETENSPASVPSASKPSRKRKRQGRSENVTAANLADLWEKVIEHKPPAGSGNGTQTKKETKRQKTAHESAPSSSSAGEQNSAQLGTAKQLAQADGKSEKKRKNKDKKKAKQDATETPVKPRGDQEEEEWNGLEEEEQISEPVGQLKEKTDKKKKKQGDAHDASGSVQSGKDGGKEKRKGEEPAPSPAPPAPTTAKLTPLQASMREKLVSARFRHLNETLYTRPSAEAFQLFQESPEMFTEYHEGFRRQVEVWPENPVDIYIADIKARAKVRFAPRNRSSEAPPLTPAQLPLPKQPHGKITTIADLGCGDAKLASALQPLTKKLRIDIHSFDLQTGGSPLVTRADIANLPLPDGSVDVAIFCLALMGTNWTDFVEEAYRVLRWRGELWVAEIKSRFAGAGGQKKTAVVAHSVGNRKRIGGGSGKKARAEEKEAEEEANLAELAVHVDGVGAESGRNGKQQETDISAFVETLRKRGFLLNRDLGENAVDMSNKMFVRMHFVKGAPAVKGKCAVEGGSDRGKDGRVKRKFIGDDDGDDGVNESKVLKPCVYKLR
ncbi:hypothetical protein N656DRAFT_710214 [Canariomyces notabilis]|uniref:Ribosomal RNA-processing protein 8 n=1 Tax=Canariomyces notabilis TaxID=2074819 RepID=A0AAN6YS88_9PEZI|nr:hypothetical protein N656DRAFT_710214 [Canariomyces arenarius]